MYTTYLFQYFVSHCETKTYIYTTFEYVFHDVPCGLLPVDDLVRDDRPELLKDEIRL